MINQEKRPMDPADLRQKAEALARERAAQAPEDSVTLSPGEIRKTLHELRVHQIELELQNEELRTAQAQIEAGRDRYFDLYDLAPVGYCTLSEQGLILEANLTAATLLGTARSALVKQPISRFILKDDQDIYYLHQKQLFETGEPQESELRLVKPDGTFIWAHLTATTVQSKDGVLLCRVVLSDVSGRIRAEHALKKSERFLRSTVDGLTAHIAVLDDRGEIILTNKAYRDFGVQNGIEPRTVSEGANYLAVCDTASGEHSEEATPFAEGIREVLSGKCRSFELEYPCHLPDEKRWFVAHVTPFDIEGPQQVIVAHENITKRKQAEEEREKLQDELNQAQKMESVGRLAGGVAHDFNNMLGVILGHTEMALEDVDPAAPLYARLQTVQHAAERSSTLTQQLLAFARKQTVAPKVIDINDTVEGMIKMLRRLIGEDIHLRWQPGRNLQSVKIDPSQIDQLLANLCVNARDAVAGMGKVTIETDAKTFDEDYCADHLGVLSGEYILLKVSDDGSGMDKETLNQIFEPFFTTKEQGKGTGLGLASIYGIVRQNNGFINVYSEPDQGTTFKIYLPVYATKSAGAVENAPDLPTECGKETILLVEDESTILEMTTRMLERLGYTVIVAATPGEAIRLAHEYQGRIDLLMTDVVMPEMNGRQLAGNLLSHYPNLKRLFMSGYTADVIAHQGVLDQGVHFIQKPFSIKDLGAKLREALEG